VFAALDANTVPIQDATLELNSDTINVQLALTPVPEVAVLSSLTVNVTPV
jgi:hypothetical protein